MLCRQLGDAVRGNRPRQRTLRHGQFCGVAIHRRGRGVDKTTQRAGRARGIQESLGGDDVQADIRLEAFAPAASDSRLPGLVEDVVDAFHKRPEVRFGEVSSDEPEPPAGGQRCDVELLELGVVVIGERVDADYLATIRHQALRDVRADEAGRPSDQAAATDVARHPAIIGRCSDVRELAQRGAGVAGGAWSTGLRAGGLPGEDCTIARVGVTGFEGADSALSPAASMAATVNVYCVPLVRPETQTLDAGALTMMVVWRTPATYSLIL